MLCLFALSSLCENSLDPHPPGATLSVLDADADDAAREDLLRRTLPTPARPPHALRSAGRRADTHALPPAPRTDPPASSKQLNTQTRYRGGKLQPLAGSPTSTVPDLLARRREYTNSHRLRNRESNDATHATLRKQLFSADQTLAHELTVR